MRILSALLLAPLLWLAGLALGAELQPIPALQAPVTDVAGVLSPADLDMLNRKLLDFSTQQGSQVVVLIVPTTAPEDIFTYSLRVAEAWKPGRKGVDDGVVLVLAINDRRSHLQVGYGLEGAIPDIRAKQILQDIMPPYLRSGDYAGAINAGTDAVIKLIRGENLPLPEPQQQHGRGDNGGAIFFAVIAGLIASAIARVILGRLLGGLAGGAVAFGIALALGLAVGLAVMAAIFAMLAAGGGRGGFIPGGFGRGGFGGGGFGGSGGGFSGGGGSFGGGGASGNW